MTGDLVVDGGRSMTYVFVVKHHHDSHVADTAYCGSLKRAKLEVHNLGYFESTPDYERPDEWTWRCEHGRSTYTIEKHSLKELGSRD